MQACLKNLEETLVKVKESWELCNAAAVLVVVGSRILSAGTSQHSAGCLAFLSECRRATYQWQSGLRHRAFTSPELQTRTDFAKRAHETAVLCMSTFDLDDEHRGPLLENPEEVKIYLECLMTLHDTEFSLEKEDFSRPLYVRCRRVVQRCDNEIFENIRRSGHTGLDLAIQSTWTSFRRAPGHLWEETKEGWLCTQTVEPSEGVSSLTVHFHASTGKLLVNGLPRGRLPATYEKHPTYVALFGHAAVECLPTAEPGMHFAASQHHEGYETWFAMHGGNLILRVRKGEKTWEMVPFNNFATSLPKKFAEDFVFWYEVDRSRVVLRPIKSPWDIAGASWVMKKIDDCWSMGHISNESCLIFPSSSTAEAYARMFEGLETKPGLQITLKRETKSVHIHIPRLQLDFFKNEDSDSICSRQFKGMRVDAEQGFGALVGLKSKLVLREASDAFSRNHHFNPKRMVIIPDGLPFVFTKGESGTLVHIDSEATSVQPYHVDSLLRQLRGNGSLASRLFLAELYALTSSCLPDPGTGQTGTQQALDILSSAAVRSLEISSEKEMGFLTRMGNLSPTRKFYPENLCEMQDVAWHHVLSPIAQSDLFVPAVQELLVEAAKVDFIRQSPLPKAPKFPGSPRLMERAIMRSLLHGHPGTGSNDTPDLEYNGSDREQSAMLSRSTLAVKFGAALRQGDSLVHLEGVGPVTTEGLCRILKGDQAVLGFHRKTPDVDFDYDAALMDKPASVLPSKFCGYHRELTANQHRNLKTKLIAWIATLAFAKNADKHCLQALLGFSWLPSLALDRCAEDIPSEASYDLSAGSTFKQGKINSLLSAYLITFGNSPERQLPKLDKEKHNAFIARRTSLYNLASWKAIGIAEDTLRSQWPSSAPHLHGLDLSYFSPAELPTPVRQQIVIWFRNLKFEAYLREICGCLMKVPSISFEVDRVEIPGRANQQYKRTASLDLLSLLELIAPPELNFEDLAEFRDELMKAFHIGNGWTMSTRNSETTTKTVSEGDSPHGHQVKALVRSLRVKANSPQEHQYLAELEESVASLTSISETGLKDSGTFQFPSTWVEKAVHAHQKILAEIDRSLRPVLSSEAASKDVDVPVTWGLISQTHHWPKPSSRNLLALMCCNTWGKVPQRWKKAIVELGKAVVDIQTAERFSKLADQRGLVKELKNFVPRSWDPMTFPDTLLLEIESGIRVRQVQEDIAAVMRSPPGEQNAVMQLNMGEGKSSVIVPMVASYLANGQKLARVIVAKPQPRQMMEMMMSKMGGLMNRQIYQMPLSRSIKMSRHQVNGLRQHYEKCMKDGGVMLVQPDHLLSFQLMTIETPMGNSPELSEGLFTLYKFFDDYSRDIIDESDENFSCKHGTIYTMGDQRGIEHAPDRWALIQQVLGYLAKNARRLKARYPKGIELGETHQTSFPIIRFLNTQATEAVLGSVAAWICENGMQGFPIAFQSQDMRRQLLQYVIKKKPSPETIATVETSEFWPTYNQSLLVLRGLFACGVLAFVFGDKRWRVNYGLDSERKPATKQVVPYRAKDCPSLRSEFSQPEVVICLTCLSYYYGGLSDEDQVLALEHLSGSDQAGLEYEQWVSTSDSLPDSFKSLKGINLKDAEQCRTQVFPHFRHSKGAVDYFLSHLVFSKEMKEFPYKLSASGWDIARRKQHALSGFSGTNDSQHVLPVSVKQLKLEAQKHTNALVLSHLMQTQNSVLCLTEVGLGGICQSCDLIKLITGMDPETRVILDVGALVLDLLNEDVARLWLNTVREDGEVQAAIFCNASDDICVVDRQGHVERLSISPFAAQLDRCLVFLDEAHTRGIDLPLPAGYRAAVTLGANLTKDRVVQACMRMRKLADGRSIVFCVPEEIESKMREATKKTHDDKLLVSDVLEWAILGTWTDLRRSMPLWLRQGKAFASQKPLWDKARTKGGLSESGAKTFLEPEAETLAQRYQPETDADALEVVDNMDLVILDQIRERCSKYEGLDLNDKALQEEQERELAPEIEQERHIERPERAEPAQHHLHPGLLNFVKDGTMTPKGLIEATLPAFEALRDTTAAQLLDVKSIPRGLLVTEDFARTIKRISKVGHCMDDYQRGVHWVLTSQHSPGILGYMVILSPFEAHRLMVHIRKSKHVVLHLFAPRHNQAYSSLDDLTLYNVPDCPPRPLSPRLQAQLTLFAGQLYFTSFSHYVQACDYLCLAYRASDGASNVSSDGFIDPRTHPTERDRCTVFQQSPVRFLQVVMAKIRRQCGSIEKTHLGRLLDGALLTEEDFEEGKDVTKK